MTQNRQRISAKEYQQKFGQGAGKRSENKFKNKRTIVDGVNFPSLLEARYYTRLKLLKQAGEVSYFHRQVAFEIPAVPKPVRYVVDFQIFYPDGRVRYVDTKGYETRSFKDKKKLVEHHYPVTIEIA